MAANARGADVQGTHRWSATCVELRCSCAANPASVLLSVGRAAQTWWVQKVDAPARTSTCRSSLSKASGVLHSRMIAQLGRFYHLELEAHRSRRANVHKSTVGLSLSRADDHLSIYGLNRWCSSRVCLLKLLGLVSERAILKPAFAQDVRACLTTTGPCRSIMNVSVSGRSALPLHHARARGLLARSRNRSAT